MRRRSLVPILVVTSAATACGGSADRPAPPTTTGTQAIVAPKDVVGSPAARVRGWPRAFCRVAVGDTRASAAARMGPPVSTSVSGRGRQDVWDHYEVELIAAYDQDGRVRKLKDGSGDSRLPCSARRTGDAALDAYAGRYQRACRDAIRTQLGFDDRFGRAALDVSSPSARKRARSARLQDRVLSQALTSIAEAATSMATATPPPALRATQRRIAAQLPSATGVEAAVAQLRAGLRPGSGIGISLGGLPLSERLLQVAPTCNDLM